MHIGPTLHLLLAGTLVWASAIALATPALAAGPGQAPPPPPPVTDGPTQAPPTTPGQAPPIADSPDDELLNHRKTEQIRVIEPEPPSGPWLEVSGNCMTPLRSKKPIDALACALPSNHEVAARASEQLGDFNGAGRHWRALQASATGQKSLEVMRRGNAMAGVEDGIAALVAGIARAAVKRLTSARQTTHRQAALGELDMRHPSALSLQLGLAWRARKKRKQAQAMWAEAAAGTTGWVTNRARLYMRRWRSRKARRGPWPVVERAYGGPGDDGINAAAVLPNGDLILGGRLSERGKEGAQLAVWRTDPAGRPRWRQTFGGVGHDEAHGVLGLDDGGVLAIGETADQGGGSDILIVRIAPNHAVLWHQRFGGPGIDRGAAVIRRSGGGFWGVTTTQAGTKEADMRLLTISADGAERQLLRLRGGGEDKATAIVQRGKGALLAGSGRGHDGAAWEGRLIAIGPRKEVLWKKPVRFADGCTIDAVAVARKGGIVAAGRTWVAGNSPQIFLASIKQGGRVRWLRADKRLVDAEVAGLVLTGRSHMAVLARGRRGADPARAWLLGYRGKRNKWLAPLAGNGVKRVGALVRAGAYGLLAVGNVDDRGHGFSDGWMTRTSR